MRSRCPNTPRTKPSIPKDSRGMQEHDIVYPYGCTLKCEKPALPLLVTGATGFPVNRPILACASTSGGGRLVVLGSGAMFADEWMNREQNSSVWEAVLAWLQHHSGVTISAKGSISGSVSEWKPLPDTGMLASRLRACLQAPEPLPVDKARLLDTKLFSFDIKLVPEVVALYKSLGIPHEPLALITPQFETPLPKLQPAVFPPAMREPPAPALELFDLDEQFGM